MNRNIFFTLFMIISSFPLANTAFAKEELLYSKIDQPGCPENSQCSEATGKKRKKFQTELKNFLAKKITATELNQKLNLEKAFPFTMFIKNENHDEPGLALWESQCKHHKKGQKYFLAEYYTDKLDLKKLSDLKFVVNPLLLQLADGSFIQLPSFSAESPVEITQSSNQKIYAATFLREDEGRFYFVNIDQAGKIQIVDSPQINNPETIICSKEISDEFLKLSESKDFYETFTCKKIWFKPTKSWVTAIYGVPCQ